MGPAAREASRQARRLPKRVENAGAKEAACQNGSWRPLTLAAAGHRTQHAPP